MVSVMFYSGPLPTPFATYYFAIQPVLSNHDSVDSLRVSELQEAESA